MLVSGRGSPVPPLMQQGGLPKGGCSPRLAFVALALLLIFGAWAFFALIFWSIHKLVFA